MGRAQTTNRNLNSERIAVPGHSSKRSLPRLAVQELQNSNELPSYAQTNGLSRVPRLTLLPQRLCTALRTVEPLPAERDERTDDSRSGR